LKTEKVMHILLKSENDTGLIDIEDKNELATHIKLESMNTKHNLKGKN